MSALRANQLVTVLNHIVRFAAEDAAGLELLENDAAALNIDFERVLRPDVQILSDFNRKNKSSQLINASYNSC